MPLDAETTLGEWLDDPVGGFFLRDYLRHAGIPEELTAPARGFTLNQIVAMSGGLLPQQTLDELVRAAADPTSG